LILTTNLSEALLELISPGCAPVDGVEVGPWYSVAQIAEYRSELPDLPFYFHGGDLIAQVGWIPNAFRKTAAYLHCTASPWVSMHITMWLPGMVWLMLRRGWRLPLPDPERATRRFVRQVRRLARALQAPVVLENVEPLPFEGYDFEVRTERIKQVLRASECGLVLDIGHARISAAALGVDVYGYLDDLPLDRVVQVHTSGPRLRGGRLVDAHEPLQAVDYALLDYVLERVCPQVVTLEYIREREALSEQLRRLRDILEAHRRSL
jgi:uncharacterized protein (UPF0276 family)